MSVGTIAGIPVSDIAVFNTSVFTACPSYFGDTGSCMDADTGASDTAADNIAKVFQLRGRAVEFISPVRPQNDGPSLITSAGLLAVHEALQSITSGACELAIVGEVPGKLFVTKHTRRHCPPC